jgi:hypothetical protein
MFGTLVVAKGKDPLLQASVEPAPSASTRSFRNSNGSKLDTQRFASLGDDVRDRFVETD